MAKLYFRYGSVGSAKTLNLLAVAHNYRQQQKKVLLMKPSLDSRFGKIDITSRAGLSIEADYLLNEDTRFFWGQETISSLPIHKNSQRIDVAQYNNLACIVIDEAQFLCANIIDDLHKITIFYKIPIIAYGLKTDFKGFLFEGSKRLLELSDTIEEIKTTCFYCNKKATYNLKYINDKPIFEGETIDLGADEKYKPVCKYCFYKQMTCS